MTRAGVFLFAAALLASAASAWRAATPAELKQIIPARAAVEKERIETEFRSASAITDGNGKYVYGVVLITAGYAAEGKYSNYFVTQVPMKVGDVSLEPGEYVFGWRRKDDENLTVKFYAAESGKFLGDVDAHRVNRIGPIESFRIVPPGEKPVIRIGRFGMSYSLVE
jgi:hypothetical protein